MSGFDYLSTGGDASRHAKAPRRIFRFARYPFEQCTSFSPARLRAFPTSGNYEVRNRSTT